MLQLHNHYRIEEFIVPLIFQDKYAIAEEFLVGSRPHQIQTAYYLDSILGKKNIKGEVESIIKYLLLNIY